MHRNRITFLSIAGAMICATNLPAASPVPATQPTTQKAPATRPAPAPIEGRPANANAPLKSYIVMFNPGTNTKAETARLEAQLNFKAKYVYDIINGFAASLTDAQVDKIRWEPSVLMLEHDQVIQLAPPGGPQ